MSHPVSISVRDLTLRFPVYGVDAKSLKKHLARVTVGGKQAWVNFTQNIGDSSSAQHIDREWRFQDVPVSGYQPGHIIEIAWDLKSDEGLQFGGWTIDDVCVVADTSSVCGDGKVTAKEACDDGVDNADRPDACRTWCQPPTCGDRIIDKHEECDGGAEGDATCTPDCTLIEPPGLDSGRQVAEPGQILLHLPDVRVLLALVDFLGFEGESSFCHVARRSSRGDRGHNG